jgi:hypothetical protein
LSGLTKPVNGENQIDAGTQTFEARAPLSCGKGSIQTLQEQLLGSNGMDALFQMGSNVPTLGVFLPPKLN